MPIHLVSHFHWDREWYRTREAFRARLVDAMDAVLDLAGDDPDFRFVLDGQTILLDDYLEVRPGRRQDLVRGVTSGQLAVGPWYVQPDSLLPSGEAHIRNLLEGRRSAGPFGAISRVAYVPDSFGHPGQFPQLFAGFGLDGFVHWRGNGDELDELGPRWRWRAPDGSTVRALHLTQGYFNAARIPAEREAAVQGLVDVAEGLERAGESPVLLMNGFDHTRPDTQVGRLVDPLGERLGQTVVRSLLDDVVAEVSEDLAVYSGELVSGRLANLLPGVWSARLPIKIRNRACEVLLERWAEPWAALGSLLGLADEGPALRAAWRALLANQAHDSICGCSIDAVHEEMAARYDEAEGLAGETLLRSLERLAGRNRDREVPELDDLEVVVFNPSPRTRTDLVRVGLDAHPSLPISLGSPAVHTLVMAGLSETGFEIDGEPVRTIEVTDPGRVRWLADQRVFDVEFVARDVPGFGCRKYRLTPSQPDAEQVDDGSVVEVDGLGVEVGGDGTLAVDLGGRRWEGLFGLEDVGDRGDSYDFEPVGEEKTLRPSATAIRRRVHSSGVTHLEVERRYLVPAGLDETRVERVSDPAEVTVVVDLAVAPGLDHIAAKVQLDNQARDHRLRLTFPTGAPAGAFTSGTTFDVVERSTTPPDSTAWVHPAPATVCQQGFVSANGLGVVAPGLPEVEVTPDGVIHLTLVRAVGWLARFDLPSRLIPAGPAMAAPGAQTIGTLEAGISLLADPSAARAADVHCGLRGVIAGPAPLLSADRSLLQIDDDEVVLSALKPSEGGDGLTLRLLNPTDESRRVTVTLGFEVAAAELVALDESAAGGDPEPVVLVNDEMTLEMGRHALTTIRLSPTPSKTRQIA